MRKHVIILLFFTSIICKGQEDRSTKMNNVSIAELLLKRYPKDTVANALVLFEHANYYIDEKREYNFTTDFYFKIKILKREGFEKAIVKIPVFDKEKIHQIEAYTYNLSNTNQIVKKRLLEKDIFTKQTSDKWKEVSFTLPNIKIGSVIEYKYSVTSPYSAIDDWYFQSDIPKVRSDFTASILGNYKFKPRVVGFLNLTRNNTSVKNRCMYIAGADGACLILDYGIDSIPAFKEEDYMLSKKNYISRVSFELESYTTTTGRVQKYTKTWKDADRKFRYDFLDNQNSKKSYFKKKVLNKSILSIENELVKAKTIYGFIKNHFNWNGNYWPSVTVKIKKAFENKKGNVFDINLSLYNALQAASIESEIVLLATRGKGLPSKIQPIYTDFNYLVVKASVDGKTYFLDATDKNLPFGLVQSEALNGQGRVMDFENGSFWQDVTLSQKTDKRTQMSLEFTEGDVSGDIIVSRTGYFALNKREELTTVKKEDVLSNFETEYPDIEVEDFKVENLKDFNKKLIEKYKVNIETDLGEGNRVRINPFFMDRITRNPFKLEERDYPVDFGYSRQSTYLLKFKIPEEYTIKKLPKSKTLSLPNKGGRVIFNISKKNNIINLYLRISINKKVYSSEEYFYLKEFYNQIIKIQDSYIELEKK